jgi:membrane protein insertase Oxa1/YidC/SpoIIIJ
MKIKTENTVRWILLPISVPVLFIAIYWLSYVTGKWGLSSFITWEIKEGDFIDSFLLVGSTIISYLSTMELSTRIAPSNKENVLKIISLIFLVVGVISITISLLYWNYQYITSIISNTIIVILSSIILIKAKLK